MSKKKDACRPTLHSRLLTHYRGVDATMQGRMIVLRGQCGVTVYACHRILLYTPRQIRLSLRGAGAVAVCGERLYCSSFSGGTVDIEGEIEGICFLKGDGSSVCRRECGAVEEECEE